MNNAGLGLGFGLTQSAPPGETAVFEYFLVDENADGIIDESSDQIIIADTN